MTSRNSNPQFTSGAAVCELDNPALAPNTESRSLEKSLEKMKAFYQVDQQAKFLHLHAETESLLQQLQNLKQQKNLKQPSQSIH
jgi:hypothetical protein